MSLYGLFSKAGMYIQGTNLDIAPTGSLKFNGVVFSSTELGYVDGVTAGTALASKALVVDANKVIDNFDFGAASDGILTGAGTAAAKYTMAGASKSALSFYITTADTADSNRCAYLRLYLTGAAGGGEAVRAFCTVGAACSVGRGIHSSLSFTGTSSITGESMAGKFTYHVPNSTLSGGTSAVLHAELYADGASSSLGSTSMAFLRCTVGGNATGAAVIDAQTYLLAISGATDGSGELVYRAQNEPTWTSKTCLIKCHINGQVTYLVGVEL